jgi:hypothetical protein
MQLGLLVFMPALCYGYVLRDFMRKGLWKKYIVYAELAKID